MCRIITLVHSALLVEKIVQQLYLCSNETWPKLYLWSHHLKIITAILKCNRILLNAKWKVQIPPKLHIFQSRERALCSIVIVNATPEIDRLRVEMVFLFDWQSRSCNIGMRKYQENTTKSKYINILGISATK